MAAETTASNTSNGGPTSPSAKHEEDMGRPVQIISIDEKGTQFHLNKEMLQEVVSRVPSADMKVSLVSVVGAFRTGKSFLLDILLRYLKYFDSPKHQDEAYERRPKCDGKSSWLWGADGDGEDTDKEKLEGLTGPDGQTDPHGFSWRSGRQRCTTGIWMWSKPFVRRLPDENGTPGEGEEVAVILVDTQGIFDSETTQMLTASIFGLSTLISSNQVYNVTNRIQEDNLQHLALFSEYGRVALKRNPQNQAHEEDTEHKDEHKARPSFKPFQTLEFLVRDAVVNESNVERVDFNEQEKTNQEYLEEILSKTEHKDLRDVREHIQNSFDSITCYQIPHPGLELVENAYDGNVSVIRQLFRAYVERYAHRLFNQELVAKRVHGRCIVAGELYRFLKVFCKVFQEKNGLPQAQVLLAATSEANSRNAVERGVRLYEKHMRGLFESFNNKYIPRKKLNQKHDESLKDALRLFDEIADFGLDSAVDNYRRALKEKLSERIDELHEINESRNVWKNSEYYLIALALAGVAWIIRMFLDLSCTPWSDVCRQSSDFLGFILGAVFLTIVIVMVVTGHSLYFKVKNYLSFLGDAIEMGLKQGDDTGTSPSTSGRSTEPGSDETSTNDSLESSHGTAQLRRRANNRRRE
eukprot:gb/GECG01009668.1/.p1 GENE.gb/GECG01009668.1/~~gb/GECG01009668.1/.p1  ORF type:complete len:638 (+),score=94.25 gb/GECG01009668.1/:1-1914(+)